MIDIAENIKPSQRGELEITDINKTYLNADRLAVELLKTDFIWLDSGTHDSLLDAGNYIQKIQHQKRIKIACLEEIAYKKGWLNYHSLCKISENLGNSSYGEYIKKIIKQSEN